MQLHFITLDAILDICNCFLLASNFLVFDNVWVVNNDEVARGDPL